MLSTKESVADTSFDGTMAVYKGLKVAVYIVDKTELSLSRNDLIELINVCILLTIFISCLCVGVRRIFFPGAGKLGVWGGDESSPGGPGMETRWGSGSEVSRSRRQVMKIMRKYFVYRAFYCNY